MLGLPGCNIEYSEVSLYGPGYSGEAGRLVEATDIPVCKGSRFTKSDWMLLDTFGIEKCLYISTSDAVIHRISLEREVSSSYKGEHAYVYLSPSGDYMYIIGAGCIYKSIYNREKGSFRLPMYLSVHWDKKDPPTGYRNVRTCCCHGVQDGRIDK